MQAEAAATADIAPLLVDLLHHASIEIAAGHPHAIETLHDQFDPGTEVFVNFVPKGDYRVVAETAAGLRRAGFVPVPHIAAGSLANREALADFVARLAGEAGVERVLLIAGDRSPPAGPFASSMHILSTGILEGRGIKKVGIAGHPEGHPMVSNAILDAALLDKCAYAASAGLALFIVTQFCFDARPILAWLTRLRSKGIDTPVQIGVAGPATVATLIKFGLRCGIGNSLRAIRGRTNLVGGLLGESGPEALLHDVAAGLLTAPDDRITGVHFFPFGGIARTGDFVAATLSRLYREIAPAVAGSPA